MGLFLLSLLWIAPTSHALSPALLSQVRAAMTATTESPTNVGKAYEACNMWDDIPMGDLPPAVRAVSSVLHATCLARVGRDEDALQAYQSCLDDESTLLEPKTLQDAIMGRASALQRLMRYDEAIEQFLLVQEADRGTLGAVTCCMRLEQLERATRILEERTGSKEVCATLALLTILQGGIVGDDAVEALQAAAPEAPLFQWLANVVVGSSTSERQYDYDILQLAAINQSPFDDPLLLQLDDKILLHRLLEQHNDLDFWPQGFILPDNMDSFKEHMTEQEANEQRTTRKDWILKSRAGYGSHGNQIVSAAQASTTLSGTESRLCQRLVDPPLLLLDGRKFSMRVYVYSFVDGSNVYLSNRGLVKIASQAYDGDDDDNRMHMTNSGREDIMMQYDFDYLRDTFNREGWSYDDFWDKIRHAVTATMRCYHIKCNEQQQSDERRELAKLGIPKILGFDFMATTSNDRQPMLLEVNRFPGLEARGEGDDVVKQTVVKEAWLCAANRLSTEHCFGSESIAEEVSYEPLSIL
jgi:hypothetical protein